VKTLTLDELIDWLSNLRKSQEGTLPTNVTEISVEDLRIGRESGYGWGEVRHVYLEPLTRTEIESAP
jgi:hypothetical protein